MNVQKNRESRDSCKHNRGYTYLESILAVLAVVLLVGILWMIFSSASAIYRKNQLSGEGQRLADNLYVILEGELSAASVLNVSPDSKTVSFDSYMRGKNVSIYADNDPTTGEGRIFMAVKDINISEIEDIILLLPENAYLGFSVDVSFCMDEDENSIWVDLVLSRGIDNIRVEKYRQRLMI